MTREKAGKICNRARWITLFLMALSLIASCFSLVLVNFTALLIELSVAYGLYLTAAFFAALRALVDPAEPDDQWKKSDNFVQL